jgi:hypothetical protein
MGSQTGHRQTFGGRSDSGKESSASDSDESNNNDSDCGLTDDDDDDDEVDLDDDFDAPVNKFAFDDDKVLTTEDVSATGVTDSQTKPVMSAKQQRQRLRRQCRVYHTVFTRLQQLAGAATLDDVVVKFGQQKIAGRMLRDAVVTANTVRDALVETTAAHQRDLDRALYQHANARSVLPAQPNADLFAGLAALDANLPANLAASESKMALSSVTGGQKQTTALLARISVMRAALRHLQYRLASANAVPDTSSASLLDSTEMAELKSTDNRVSAVESKAALEDAGAFSG